MCISDCLKSKEEMVFQALGVTHWQVTFQSRECLLAFHLDPRSTQYLFQDQRHFATLFQIRALHLVQL